MAKKPKALERIQSWDGSGKPGMAKKPKAWRATYDPPSNIVHCNLNRKNCTVVPDGATVPLPASVRRQIHHLRDALRRIASVTTVQSDYCRAEQCQQIAREAWHRHHQDVERATKAEGKS